MTVLPVAAPVARTSATAPAPGAGGEEFADLVQQHLGDGGRDHGAATAVLDEPATPPAAPSDGLAAVLAGLVAGTASTTPVGTAERGSTALAGPTAAGPVEGVATAALGPAPTVSAIGRTEAGGAVVAGAGLVGTAGGQQVGAAGQPAAAATTGAGSATQAGSAAGPAPETAAGRMSTDQASTGANDPGDSAAVVADLATSDGSTAHADGDGSERTAGGAAAITQVGPATAGGAAGATSEVTRGNPISDQVFDHVTRLVSRGDGTHRITLRLHPADLGEVKVVLTVKDGTVDVTLAAGAHAREALREGSPHLRSLLDLTGATTGQVVIRDLSGTSVSATAQQQAAGNAPDQGRQQSADGGDAAADPRAGFGEGSADASGDDHSAGGGLPPGLDAGHPADLVGRAAVEAAAAGVAGSRRTSLSLPSRVDLNL